MSITQITQSKMIMNIINKYVGCQQSYYICIPVFSGASIFITVHVQLQYSTHGNPSAVGGSL